MLTTVESMSFTWGHLVDITFKGECPPWANPPRDNFLYAGDVEAFLETISGAIEQSPKAILLRKADDARNFCCGGDFAYLRKCLLTEAPEDRDIEGAMTYLRSLYSLCQQIALSKVPIITLLQGEAIGLGAEIACASSHILVTPGATMSVPQILMGLMMLSIPRLIKKVGPGLAFLIQVSTPPDRPLTSSQMLSLGLAEPIVHNVEEVYRTIPAILKQSRALPTDNSGNMASFLDKSKTREALIAGIQPEKSFPWLDILRENLGKIRNRDALKKLHQVLTEGQFDDFEETMRGLLKHPDVLGVFRKAAEKS